MDAFLMRHPERPWGDYGNILFDGMSEHQERRDRLIQLERTGPFIPPITFPGIWDVVVTDELKQMLEGAGLTGLQFQPVLKAHIVYLDWVGWDQQADEPLAYPETGEPEGYVLDAPHSAEIAKQLGELWELRGVEMAREDLVSTDVWRIEGREEVFISGMAKDWFEQMMTEWVICIPYIAKK